MKLPKVPRRIDLASKVYSAIEVEEAEQRAQPHLRMSSIGRCERDLWAELQGVESERPFDGRMLTLFRLGHAIERHVIEGLRLAGREVLDVDPETACQWEVKSPGGEIVGHIDGVIVDTGSRKGERAILEIKSASEKRFEALLASEGYEEWNPGYADQLHAYMGWSGIRQAIAVVYCKNDSRIYAERIGFDPKRFDGLVAKVDRILAAEDDPPKRPPEATSQYCKFCKWCDRNEWCWSVLREVKFAE